jgi:beta-galactosidase
LKKAVDSYHAGKGPYMVAEYYPGWLDHWGENFEKVATDSVIKDLQSYLKNNISFNIYMAHGGTNFGFTSGANYTKAHQIQPDLTSYDYDAPISEAGWVTPKFMAIRNLLKRYVSYPITDVPQQIPVIQLPPIKLTKAVNLFSIAEHIKPVIADTPKTFESLNQGSGYVLYRRKFNSPISGTLNLQGLRDYALVYVNGKKVAELNRQQDNFSCNIQIPANGQLDILVENMGRINYGSEIINNLKGLISAVKINNMAITGNWKMYRMPMNKIPALGHKFICINGNPTIYQGSFKVTHIGDTFLDMKDWGKGIVFINGYNLGRYWKIGPQQTLYLPGCWLKNGNNTITILDMQNDKKHSQVNTVKIPVLDDLAVANK